MSQPIILDRCPCGKPWQHYIDREAQEYTEKWIIRMGPTFRWIVGDPLSPRTFLVARHYLAQHGLQGWNTDIGFPELGMPGCLIFPEIPAITCSGCGLTSYNPEDVENKFCGHCGVFYSKPVAEE